MLEYAGLPRRRDSAIPLGGMARCRGYHGHMPVGLPHEKTSLELGFECGDVGIPENPGGSHTLIFLAQERLGDSGLQAAAC
jgi:hypothetical protein